MSRSVEAIEHQNRNSIPARTHALAFKDGFQGSGGGGARSGLTASGGCSRNGDVEEEEEEDGR